MDLWGEPGVQGPATDAEALEIAGRGVYPYSVIPGGAFTVEELTTAIERDAVVAAHYAHLDSSRVRAETVPHNRYVHVSYRKGNNVYWTKKKVLLRRGETILTDGTTQIRARCGNCISEQPMEPTSPEEPETVEFDRLTDDPPALGWGGDPFEPAGAPATSPLAFVNPGGWGGSNGAAAPPTGGGAAIPLAGGRLSTRESGTPMTLDEPFIPGSPKGDDDAPVAFVRPSPDGPMEDLFPDDMLIPPDGPTPDVPLGSPEEPAAPAPVPVPGTILLVGGGVAALLHRIRARAA